VARLLGICCAVLLALLFPGASTARAQDWGASSPSDAVRGELAYWHATPVAQAPTRKAATRDVVAAIRQASQSTGVDFVYLVAQAHLESGLNPEARAQSSSALGLYQFIESTWLASLERHGERLGLTDGMAARSSRAALLELRSNPAAASLLAAAHTLDNAAALQAVLGRAPKATELYLAHFLGSGGAARFLSNWQRAPQASAAAFFPREAHANRAIFYGSGGQPHSLDAVLQYISDKVNGAIEATADLHRLAQISGTKNNIFPHILQLLDDCSSDSLSYQQGEMAGLRPPAIEGLNAAPCAPDRANRLLDRADRVSLALHEYNNVYIWGVEALFSNECDAPPRSLMEERISSPEPPSGIMIASCHHTELCYLQGMSTSIITRVRELVDSGKMTRAGLARAAGLHANTLRDAAEADWNPTAETLQKLEVFLDSNDQRPVLVGIDEIIDEARNGRMYILVDDEDRENEGDLIIPAQMATPQAINFMAMHGRGLICLALTKDRVDHLGLQPMSRNNKESMQTAFTISIEAKEGVTTGISAADRARTISVAIDAAKGPEDIVTPGHVFPLMARDGGTLVRAGHTEAAVDISRLAGLNPSGVICEIMNEDGTMARLDDLVVFARKHDLKIGTIRDLIAYRMRNDHLVERLSERAFTSDYGGQWRMITYRDRVAGSEAYVLQKGHVVPGEPTLARVHPISVFDDVLGQPGPRKRTLQRAMQAIGDHGAGVIVILTGRVGTGAWQPGEELRNIGIGSQILVDLGVSDLVLLSNSRPDLVALEGFGLTITDFHPIPE